MARFKVSSSRNKPRGLGDSIERVAKATGISQLVEAGSKALKKDCGCSKRRDSLNRKFPYKK
tara:strand:- start:3225 stop:3410 length:186 start_codon:yes stop_codon:yes gene_type:complete